MATDADCCYGFGHTRPAPQCLAWLSASARSCGLRLQMRRKKNGI